MHLLVQLEECCVVCSRNYETVGWKVLSPSSTVNNIILLMFVLFAASF